MKRRPRTVNKSLEAKKSGPLATMNWDIPKSSSSDIIIPKILAMQGLSDMVTDGKAKLGEFRESVSGRLIGSTEKPFDIIPVSIAKMWHIQKRVGKKYEFCRKDPINPQNEDLEWEYTENGEQYKRERAYEVYCLLPEEADGLPFLMVFKNTSLYAGRKIWNQMYIFNPRAGLTPASHLITVSGSIQKNDMGTYMVMDARVSRKATDEEVAFAYQWSETIAGGTVKESSTEREAQHVPEIPF